jgi:hypothetical protein
MTPYRNLITCRRLGWCWMCQGRPAVVNDGVNVPMCKECKREWWTGKNLEKTP